MRRLSANVVLGVDERTHQPSISGERPERWGGTSSRGFYQQPRMRGFLTGRRSSRGQPCPSEIDS